MLSHWIIVPVVLPAILGPLIVLAMRQDLTLQRITSTLGTAALAVLAVALLIVSSTHGPELYRLGDWPAPFGIVLMLDRLSALMLVLTALLALVVQLYVIGTGWDARGRHFHALLQFQLMGLNGAFLTADAFNLFVFFEVLLIASYALMIHGGGKDRLRAGVQYVAFNLVGSSLFLFALALLYGVAGTLNMADLAVKVAAMPEGDLALVRVGAVLLMLVFAVKGALVPLQFWLPGTYANAPGPVAALFAIMTKVGAYAMIRIGTLVFPPEVAATGTLIADLLFWGAIATLILGSVGMLGATTLPRLAAFAGIASMGTLFLGVSSFTVEGLTAALFYLIHSTLAGALLFLIADLILSRRGGSGLGGQGPDFAQKGILSALFLLVAIALAGMPPLSGFLGKLMVMQALTDHAVLVWSVILVTSFLMILAFARAGSNLFWKTEVTEDTRPAATPQPLALVATGALVALLVVQTVFAGTLTGWLQTTAAALDAPTAYVAAADLPPLAPPQTEEAAP